MIFWKKKLIKCCRCKNEYSFDKNLYNYNNDYILGCPFCGLKHKIDFKLFDKKIENLKKVDRLNLTAITVGNPAVDQANYTGGNTTFMDKTVPANASGKITSVEIYARNDLTLCEVAIFYRPDPDNYPNNFTTRSNITLGTVTSGSKQTFTKDSSNNDISMDVVAGDFIGIYFYEGKIRIVAATGGGMYISGDFIPTTNQQFSAWNYKISLCGIGATVEAGWPHKWNGVTIGKLNSAVISKWNGVA